MSQIETMTDTSSDKAKIPNAIIMPGTDDYVSVWEQLLKEAAEKGKNNIHQNPPLDALGRPNPHYKEVTVAAKTGEILSIEDKRKQTNVLLFRDTNLVFPELALRVFVTGPEGDQRGFASMFSRALCQKADNITDADLIVFTGGADVDPSYYGEKPHPATSFDEDRDYEDFGNFWIAYNEGIPMLGVCRGAQLLAVGNGGKLVQHVDEHQGEHSMYDKKSREVIDRVSSVHHQQVLKSEGLDVIGTAFKSTERWYNPTKCLRKNGLGTYEPDIEAFFIRDFCGIGIQGHPEYKGYEAFTRWSLKLIEELVCLNPDVDFVDNGLGEYRRRLKPEFLEERKLRIENRVVKKNKRDILTVKAGEPSVEGE